MTSGLPFITSPLAFGEKRNYSPFPHSAPAAFGGRAVHVPALPAPLRRRSAGTRQPVKQHGAAFLLFERRIPCTWMQGREAGPRIGSLCASPAEENCGKLHKMGTSQSLGASSPKARLSGIRLFLVASAVYLL